jgi:hypothetical protein
VLGDLEELQARDDVTVPMKHIGGNVVPKERESVMQRGGDDTIYRCTVCELWSFDREDMEPDGVGHAGSNSRCRACEGEFVETVEPDVPLMWPDGDGRQTEPDAETDGDRGDGDGLDELTEKVRQYIERERLADEEVTVAKVAGGLLENPETVREVLERIGQ